MLISILCSNLSENSLGSAHLLGKILQRRYDVEIVGPAFSGSIWEPVADDDNIQIKRVMVSGKIKPYFQIGALLGQIRGDIIYASKPLLTSFGIGLYEKLRRRKKLILDVDDWEVGFLNEYYGRVPLTQRARSLASAFVFMYQTYSYWNCLLFEKLSSLADAITVSNRFLQKRFGGELVWHARDTDAFNPAGYDGATIRKRHNIKAGHKVIMFFGTPRPYKGIENLVSAMAQVEDKDSILCLVGINYSDPYCKKVIENARNHLGQTRFFDLGMQPFEKVPEFLAMADVVVIPQRKQATTVGQLPAKVFDAMSMAKPIIATNISDLPEILDGCGWIIEPDQPDQLAETIRHVLDNPKEAEKRGATARAKCIERYSWNAMEGILTQVFSRYAR